MSKPSSKNNLERLTELRTRLRTLTTRERQLRELELSLRCFPDLADYLRFYTQCKGKQTLTGAVALQHKQRTAALMHAIPVRCLVELLWALRDGCLHGDKAVLWWVAFVLRLPAAQRSTAISLLDQSLGCLLTTEDIAEVLRNRARNRSR